MNTNLPKSLHTVTVLVNVARAVADLDGTMTCDDALSAARAILGYADSPDTYGLADKARAVLNKECAS